MNQNEAIIERIWQIERGWQRLELMVDASLEQITPGQSLLVSPNPNHWEPYLRGHWFPVKREDGALIVERPTSERYSPGQVVDVIGPLGESYPWIGGGGKHLLLIAQDSPPTPLLMLAQEALNQMAEVTLLLLGSALDYPFAGIPPAVEVIDGEKDERWREDGALLNWAHQIFVLADAIMWLETFSSIFHLVKTARAGRIPPNFLFGVPMMILPCGTGVCNACMVRCKTSMKQVCTQGPALDLTEVHLL